MGDSRASPGFGQVDLDLEEDPNVTVRPPPSSTTASAKPSPVFGSVDLDLDGDGPPPPPSTSRVFGTERNTRATKKNMAAQNDESTRVVQGDALGDALSAATRPPSPLRDDGDARAWAEVDEALFSVGQSATPFPSPSPSPTARPSAAEAEGSTRAWDVDQALLSVGEHDEPPPSSRAQAQPAPSGSGVATRGGRVAAMRELYAKGDADGALALAATLGDSLPPSGSDHPDASIVVEFGEQSIDLSDPFGGLVPIDDDLASRVTAPPPGVVASAPPPGAAAQLTLTERHSIPRLLKGMGEISKLKIDHRAGFLLAHVDGMQTLEEILDICAMPTAEALELIANLKRMGVIEFE